MTLTGTAFGDRGIGRSRTTARLVTVLLIATLACPSQALAQAVPEGGRPEIWRAFVEKLEPGKTLKVRLRGGPQFKATLLQVSADGIVVQPKTRAAVPPQRVAFDRIDTLAVDESKGMGLGKAIAIGAGVGAGVWLALMAFAFAVWGD